MANFPIHLVRRDYASRCLDLVKLRTFVPCDVSDDATGYTGRIVEAVFVALVVVPSVLWAGMARGLPSVW
jgi:hypothetical protein